MTIHEGPGFKESTMNVITNYNLAESVKTGKFNQDSFYDELLNSDEFCNLVGGINIRNVLNTDTNVDSKRINIEEYAKVVGV
jgi:hypothetical protein